MLTRALRKANYSRGMGLRSNGKGGLNRRISNEEPRDNLQTYVEGQLSDMAFLSTSSPAHASHLPGLDSERAKEVGHERVAEDPLRGYVQR